MTLRELRRILQEAGVREDAYSLEGGLPNERYAIQRSAGGGWDVYYSERGVRSDTKSFDSEDDACRELLERLLRDRSTRE